MRVVTTEFCAYRHPVEQDGVTWAFSFVRQILHHLGKMQAGQELGSFGASLRVVSSVGQVKEKSPD